MKNSNKEIKPGLFGLNNSNRDFSKEEYWGKNHFNSSFPIALLCYMHSKGIKPVYIKVNDDFEVRHEELGVNKLLKKDPAEDDTYFSFETPFSKYQQYFVGTFPRNDVTILEKDTGNSLSSFEIKLTALPDNQTCLLDEKEFGSELVVRPDTIIYQAAMIIDEVGVAGLDSIFKNKYDKIKDWTETKDVLPFVKEMVKDYTGLVKGFHEKQEPLIIQPIWKTKGKNPTLSKNCLDVFIWSNFSMAKLYIPTSLNELTKINRQTRTLIWLIKMLYDYIKFNKFDGYKIIDLLSFNTKNDKAFSVGGNGTYPLMKSIFLEKPRIKKAEIKNIILGGGQNLLSPERRFDAIIYNTPSLFEEELA